MPDVLRVKCANCNSTLKAPPKFQGKRVKCPKCGNSLQIPRRESSQEPEFLADDAFEDDGFGAGGIDHYENFGDDASEFEDYEDYEDVDEFERAYGHRSAPPPAARKPKPEPKQRKRKRRRESRVNSGTFDGMFSIDGGVLGGLLMMLIAVVWFVGGLSAGILFYYPPVLFIVGLVAVIRGL